MKSYRPETLLPKGYPLIEQSLEKTNQFRVDKLNLDLGVIKTLANPYQCPKEFLPLLAYSFGSDFYWELEDLAEDMQRDMIANSLYLHRKKGTVWAIKRVLEILGFDIEVIEWWQNDRTMEELSIKPDKPYKFAVILDVAKFYATSKGILDTDTQRRILKYLYIYKNVRSHFDLILKTNMEDDIAVITDAELIECSVKELEFEDFSQSTTPSEIAYSAMANMLDTDERLLESVDSEKTLGNRQSNFAYMDLGECRVHALETKALKMASRDTFLSYFSLSKADNSEIRELEFKDNKYSPNQVSIFNLSKVTNGEIRNLETKPKINHLNEIRAKSLSYLRDSIHRTLKTKPKERIEDSMNLKMIINMQEIMCYG